VISTQTATSSLVSANKALTEVKIFLSPMLCASAQGHKQHGKAVTMILEAERLALELQSPKIVQYELTLKSSST
jgi:hypothetical protein